MAGATTRLAMMRRAVLMRAVLGGIFILLFNSALLRAQHDGNSTLVSSLAWSTDSTGPRRFVSVHGRRAAIFGYSQAISEDRSASGLEVWAYPVQILRSYGVSFREQGTTTGIEGEAILRRIVYSPEAVTRMYAGPDFIVREKLFVPLDEPGAIISYAVESAHPIDIDIHFIPVLDLMWPAGIGGQETKWSSKVSAYLIRELTHRFTASVGTPDIVAHDETPNRGQDVGREPGLAFTIRAEANHQARVIIVGSGPGSDASATARRLLENADSLEKTAVDHYDGLLGQALQIETPDADVNRALAWSEIALDQAWVCNPDLGCGVVAGYGPSRKARRPQYDWFFAGDGMNTVRTLIATGEYERARQELEFIIKRQDQKTGMIWHELSQSAGLIDWAKYPYMFVHVDLTFDFLNTIGDYFTATGDQDFIKAHWPSIESAYGYCRSLVDAKDGLPRLPADKEGAREQDRLTDELSLSASWAGASLAFAELAAAVGHTADEADARAASDRAIRAIGERYWCENRQFLIPGYTRSGSPLMDRDAGPTHAGGKSLFSEAQIDEFLDQLAASDFQTDWGTRSDSSKDAGYNPDSYSKGSVWAIITSETASQFWTSHRPATAQPIWRALVPWSSLDSLGHMHEVTAGNFYHEEVESVPEQTWSSAGFLRAAVNGLFGVGVDGLSNTLTFVPHLPAQWNAVSLRHLRVGRSVISAKIYENTTGMQLDLQNDGAPVDFVFEPEIPLGAELQTARLGSQPIAASIVQHAQDTHVKVAFRLAEGSTSVTINYGGGVVLVSDPPSTEIGETSRSVKIIGVHLRDNLYTVDFDYLPSANSGFELRTPWKIKDVQGASLETLATDLYRVTVSRQSKESLDYERGKVSVKFAHE